MIIFAAGDGCFMIGMGGKKQAPPKPSYEPFKCCPAKVKEGTKVAQATKKEITPPKGGKKKEDGKKGKSQDKATKGKKEKIDSEKYIAWLW